MSLLGFDIVSLIDDAKPAAYFAIPPYRSELLDTVNGWSGIMNANGINCLTFTSRPGAVMSRFEDCEEIARRWNGGALAGSNGI